MILFVAIFNAICFTVSVCIGIITSNNAYLIAGIPNGLVAIGCYIAYRSIKSRK